MKAIGLTVRVTVFLPDNYTENEAKFLAGLRLKEVLTYPNPSLPSIQFDVLDIKDAEGAGCLL
jgi:hypothetical protein